MLKLQVIGNLGADATIQSYNGKEFVSFRVAHSESWADKATGEVKTATTWVSCILNGNGGGLTKYLKSGTKVYVDGSMSLNTYSSPKTHQIEVGVNLNVRSIELCGGKKEADTNTKDSANNSKDDNKPF